MVGFRATHRLAGDFGSATERHPHDYRVRAAVRGESLRGDGTLCDLAWLRQLVDDAVAPLDGGDLNDVEQFAARNPTAEAVAEHVYQAVARRMDGVRELAVEVWETPDAYARYEGPLGSDAGASAGSHGR